MKQWRNEKNSFMIGFIGSQVNDSVPGKANHALVALATGISQCTAACGSRNIYVFFFTGLSNNWGDLHSTM